jgi:glutaminyl-peptide cyclotransferase
VRASQGYESALNFEAQGVKVKYKMNNRKIQAPEYRKSPLLLFKALTVITLSDTYFCGNYYNMRKLIVIASLLLFAACNNGTSDPKPETPVVNSPKIMSYSVLATYPHDTGSYTQGLIVYNGQLYEGTGNYGVSRLRRVDVKSGKALQDLALDPKYFGEGITILRDTIYQLTYKEGKVFVYTLKDFKKIKEYDVDFEGWGITNDGKNLIISAGGSNELLYYNPAGFTLLRRQSITEASMPAYNLNELEFIDGFIYANQYQTPYILKISPTSGEVVAKTDISDLWTRSKARNANLDVPNGIAYDAATKKIYVTGKWWPELYEVQFGQ